MTTTSREYREKLISEVRRYPVLYNTRHEHHRDIDVRDRCWTEIAARLGANSEVLKREWKILRDSLRQSLKKSRTGALTKAGTPCKKWHLHARMAFLLPYMTRRNERQRLGNIKLDMQTEVSESGDAEEWSAAAGGGGDAEDACDALELFFASVCASARRLPAPQQRALKRRVLDALLRCEEHADPAARTADSPHSPAETSKPELGDEF